MCFSATVGRHFSGFCPDFQGFYPDFDKSKLLGVRLHLLRPRFLHHWSRLLKVSAEKKSPGWRQNMRPRPTLYHILKCNRDEKR